VDGKVHKLSEYARTPVLAIVFESNHCPVSMLYETRIKRIYEDYRNKGVTVVAINPNSPRAVRLDEMGYTDVPDSLEAMKIRAAYRHREWPYL
jgi:thiol-disulfide isomerase/thioredoxin